MNKATTSHNCSTCLTRRTTEWRDLESDDLQTLDKTKKTIHLNPGEIVFNQGDKASGVYCIQNGLIGLRRVDEGGKSILIRLCSSGNTVGYNSFLVKSPQYNSAEALIPSTVCFIPGSTVSNLVANSPKVGERFLQHTLADLAETEDDYARNLTKNTRHKFLHILLMFYERVGYKDAVGLSTLELPILRRELAELMGVQPESISRVLRELQDEQLLKVDAKKILFTDMDTILEEICAY